jgi:hypothetical protein
LCSVGRAALLFFYSPALCVCKKINVLHRSVSQATKNYEQGGNTAEGFCVFGSVCEQKPKPCCVSAIVWLCIVADVFILPPGFASTVKQCKDLHCR